MDISQATLQDTQAPPVGGQSEARAVSEHLPIEEFITRSRGYLHVKRAMDFASALIQLILFGPLMLAIAASIKLFDHGPVFFTQERLTGGPSGPRVFRIVKFRTMVLNAEQLGAKITAKHDPRITPCGRMLRASKLDELPQLFNILAGDMSFVGPRPQTLGYVSQFQQHYDLIHSMVPAGLTDLATLKYRDEGRILASCAEPERVYIEQIMPDKIACHYGYLRHVGPWTDFSIILQTLYHVFVRKPLGKLLRRGI
jgi:lipopolysaccharide/colanic/teichoic acid biosynthesis glycosyltransferase